MRNSTHINSRNYLDNGFLSVSGPGTSAVYFILWDNGGFDPYSVSSVDAAGYVEADATRAPNALFTSYGSGVLYLPNYSGLSEGFRYQLPPATYVCEWMFDGASFPYIFTYEGPDASSPLTYMGPGPNFFLGYLRQVEVEVVTPFAGPGLTALGMSLEATNGEAAGAIMSLGADLMTAGFYTNAGSNRYASRGGLYAQAPQGTFHSVGCDLEQVTSGRAIVRMFFDNPAFAQVVAS